MEDVMPSTETQVLSFHSHIDDCLLRQVPSNQSAWLFSVPRRLCGARAIRGKQDCLAHPATTRHPSSTLSAESSNSRATPSPPKAKSADDKKDHNSALHLLEAFPLSAVFDTSFTSTKAPQPATQNGNFEFPQDVSLFLAGAWAEHVGSFVQVTYDAQGDHFSWDNTDIRYANNNGKFMDKSLTYGVTLNNNPTVEDLWNSTPAWGFPFVSSDVAPGPTAGAIINGGLAQDVAGIGGYAMWNDHLYLAGTIYRSEHIGGSQPNPGTDFGFNIRGVAPYWRLAYQTSSENNNLEIGTYGMHMKSSPGAITGLEDSYTDWAADFQYDRTLPSLKSDVLSFRGSYIRENSSLDASFVEGAAGFVSHHLNTAQANVEYHFGTRVAATAGFFDVTGTADPVLFASAPVSGSANGSPQSNGYLFNFRGGRSRTSISCSSTPDICASTAPARIMTRRTQRQWKQFGLSAGEVCLLIH